MKYFFLFFVYFLSLLFSHRHSSTVSCIQFLKRCLWWRMAELRRNQRGEIGSQHVKAHYAAASVHVDLISQTQTNESTCEIDQDTAAYVHLLFLNNVNGLFHVPFQLKCKDEGDKPNGLTSPSNDAIIWTEKGVLKWCYTGRFATTIFCATKSWYVGTML